MNLYALQVWSEKDEVWKTFYVSAVEDEAAFAMESMEVVINKLFRVVQFSYTNLDFLGIYARDVKIIQGHRANA